MPGKSAHVKNEKQYEALKEKGMSKERAAKIANSPDASRKGGKNSHSGSSRSSSSQGGTTAQKKAAGAKGGPRQLASRVDRTDSTLPGQLRVGLASLLKRGVHRGGTPRAWPASVAHLTHGTMRYAAAP